MMRPRCPRRARSRARRASRRSTSSLPLYRAGLGLGERGAASPPRCARRTRACAGRARRGDRPTWASFRPCFTSTLNQLVDPLVDELGAEDMKTMSSGATTSAPKMPTVRAVRREPGTLCAVVAHQAPGSCARRQYHERDDRERVDRGGSTAAAGSNSERKLLHALREQQEGADADGRPQQHLPDREPAQGTRGARHYTGSVHVYQSLTRAQSSVQKRMARMVAGRCPRVRTPARTLIV